MASDGDVCVLSLLAYGDEDVNVDIDVDGIVDRSTPPLSL